MKAKPVNKTAIYQDIVSQIMAMIKRGELSPGDRLPAERKLAELFAVSRTTVREAIRTLSEQDLLESRQGAGTFVSAKDQNRFADMFAGAILRGQPGLRDIFEVRRMLEPGIAALAAENATEDDVRRLEAVLAAQSGAMTAHLSGESHDLALHGLLAEATGNKVLCALMGTLHEELLESRVTGLQSPARQQASLSAHRAIVEAVRAKNPQRAQQAMLAHLDEIEHIVFSDTR